MYLFDSHSRGPKGHVAANGTACLLSFDVTSASTEISKLIHRNVQPHGVAANNERYFHVTVAIIAGAILSLTFNARAALEAYTFSITPIILDIEQVSDSLPVPSPTVAEFNESTMHSPVILDIVGSGSSSAGINNCVFHSIDVVEPELDDVLGNRKSSFFFKRKTGAPVSKAVEARLEELSFIGLFPYGMNGCAESRLLKQTPLEYFQARVMSTDLRFSDPTYLFYALCQVEDYQIQQKIQVCCEMSRETEDSTEWCYDPRNVHLVLKSIRGTASYWQSYCSRTLAMCRQLGAPDLFLTFSYDDLNGWDCINSMYKRLHGFTTPDVDPSTLSYDERKSLLDCSPITPARHFNYRVSQLFKLMRKHSQELFGYKIKDFTYRIEFQNRGSGTLMMGG